MIPGDPLLGPPLSFQEQELLDHVRAALARELPFTEGPYGLSTALVPEEERSARGGQAGPVLHDSERVFALLHLDGLDRSGGPWGIDQALRICARAERDHARVAAIVEALARVARRLMRDAQDDRYGERPWLGLVHLDGALRVLERAPARRTRTADECEAVMLGARELREVLAPPPEEIDPAVAALDAWLAAHATIARTQTIELASVPDPSWSRESRPSPHGVEITRGGLWGTLRLIVFDPDGSVRDIKEQQLLLAPARTLADMPRVIAFLDGLAKALPRAFDRWGDQIDTMMPHDMVDLDVIDLKKPRTADDFAEAFARRWKLPAG